MKPLRKASVMWGLRLSPAYDIVCSKAVIPKELDCALTINGKQNKIGRSDFEQLAGTLKIPPKVVDTIFARFAGAAATITEQISRSRLPVDMQEKMRQIFHERHQRLFRE